MDNNVVIYLINCTVTSNGHELIRSCWSVPISRAGGSICVRLIGKLLVPAMDHDGGCPCIPMVVHVFPSWWV